MKTQDSTPRLQPDVRFRRVGDEGVILCQEDAKVIVVNELGIAVLERLDGRSIGELLDFLEALYEVDRTRLETDVWAYLDTLVERGVIHNDGAAGA